MRKIFTVQKRLGMHVTRTQVGKHTVTELVPAAALLCTGERCATTRLNFIGQDKHGRPLCTKKSVKRGKLRHWIDKGVSANAHR